MPILDTDPVHAYGTLCVPGPKGQRVCADFTTYGIVLRDLQ